MLLRARKGVHLLQVKSTKMISKVVVYWLHTCVPDPSHLTRQGVHCLKVESKDDLKSRRLLNTEESMVLLGLLAKGYITISRQVHEAQTISKVVVLTLKSH